MNAKSILLTIAILLVYGHTQAFTRQDINVHSPAMSKDVPVRVILPDNYPSLSSLPTVYLLHGHGDTYTAWDEKGKMCALADLYNVIVVMPDGGKDSWFLDSPINPTYRYETFMTSELVPYIDAHYKTDPRREARAIAGLSMGGHGAFYLSFRHQNLFGAASCLSGGVDIRPFPKSWGLPTRLGSIEEHPGNWEEHTVTNLTSLLVPNALKLSIDCGADDFFFDVNLALHHKLKAAGIPHDFTVRPGAHNWDYWRNAIQYTLLFFNNFFNESR